VFGKMVLIRNDLENTVSAACFEGGNRDGEKWDAANFNLIKQRWIE
jgi:hypothetical protein